MEQKPSMRERLEAARQHRQESQVVQAARRELKEAIEGLMFSRDFFEALTTGDGLGIAGLRALGYPQPRAVASWLVKPWEEWLKEISFFATLKGAKGEAVREILAVVGPLNENEVTREVLSGYFSKVVRPSQRIYQPLQFDSFLWHLAAEGLASKYLKQPAFGRALEWKGEWYGPSSQLKISRALWPFVERAKRRVERYSEIAETVLPKLEWLEEQRSLDNDFDLQNLHRLLTHPQLKGMMVVWEAKSKMRGEWDEESQTRKLEEARLLAILIGRQEKEGHLSIQGWEADKPLSFPKEEEVVLPPFDISYTLTEAIASISFWREALEGRDREEREGWWRVRWLMNRWLSREGRYRVPALPPGQSKPTKKGKKKTPSS